MEDCLPSWLGLIVACVMVGRGVLSRSAIGVRNSPTISRSSGVSQFLD